MVTKRGLTAMLMTLFMSMSFLPTQIFAGSSVDNEVQASTVLNRTTVAGAQISQFSTLASNQKRGDLNEDGSVNSIDFGIYRLYLLGSRQIDDMSIADVSGDGLANSIDFGYIRQFLLGMISVFPADEATNTVEPTPVPVQTPTNVGTLPEVNSVETDGPFSVVIDQNVGPNGRSWVARPANLCSQGVDKHPIFLWGPGAGSSPSMYEDILRRVASHGFVVFSEASSNSGAEMKAGIDWIISQNSNSSSAYYNKLDTSKIAAGGHSLGSVAAFGVASDSRVTTTIHISGGSLDGSGASKLRKPTALICGLNDNLALSNTQNDYRNATVPVWYGEIRGAGHGDGPPKGLSALVAWLRWHLGGETDRKDMFIGEGVEFDSGIWQSQYKNW